MDRLDSSATLNNGVKMPWLGLGVWQAGRGKETYDAVRAALEVGYRHVDTAKIYGNEADVGRAVRESGVPRGDVFVTTKLWNADHGYDRTLRACDASLAALGLEQLDLYLVHWPESRRKESWKAMQKLLRDGKCRAIGVSNYTVAHLEELLADTEVVPAVNQVEMHPFLYQRELILFCEKHRIQVEAYSPLARGQRMNDKVLAAVAKRLARTPAQVLIRWALEHRLVVIPKSAHRERIAENAQVFDFAISNDDMAKLDALDENLRTCWDPTDVG
jgi:diketogulonate reductase-like aldo/keto reductase